MEAAITAVSTYPRRAVASVEDNAESEKLSPLPASKASVVEQPNPLFAESQVCKLYGCGICIVKKVFDRLCSHN